MHGSRPVISDRRNLALFMLALIYMVNFIDRTLLNTVGEAVKLDMGLSDLQIGLAGGLAFSLTNAIAALPIARLAERFSRVHIISISLTIWSLFTAACGLANNFTQLFVSRIFVGVAEAGAPAPSQSLISDFYPRQHRARALAFYMTGTAFGTLVGATISGLLVESIGWRGTFVFFAIPGVFIALCFVLTVREPRRGQNDTDDQTDAAPTGFWTVVRSLFGSATYRHMLAGAVLLNFGLLGMLQFLHPLFVRVYHLPYAQAASVFGLSAGLSALIGVVVGGVTVSRLVPRDSRWYAWLPAIGCALATPFYVLALLQPSWLACAILVTVAGMGHTSYFGPFYAVVQNLAHARSRATATAISTLLINGVGTAFGPIVFGFMSDHFAQRYYTAGIYAQTCRAGTVTDLVCAKASGEGLKIAMIIGSFVFLWAAAHFVIGSRTLKRDLGE